MKKLPKYKTQNNAQQFPKVYEQNSGISLTIQSEVLSLRDIVEKFSREYPVHLQRQGYYDEIDENDFDNVDPTRDGDFDLIDAHELKTTINERYKQKRAKNEDFSAKNDDTKKPINPDPKTILEP